MRIVLATANPGKQREFAALLAAPGWGGASHELILQSALGIVPIEETGSSFEANALLKARHAARESGLAALADDSGLEVDALEGRPGVHSARYAGASASDADNNARLLEELGAVPRGSRRARYRCVLALVQHAEDRAPLLAEGVWEGQIATAAAGSGGFGYDVLFIPEGLEVTAAQLPAERKHTLSHRAQALQGLRAALASRAP
jgi:XTP/dITP diphosphohydrolase